MSLWRKRNVHHSEQKHDNLVNIVTRKDLSMQSNMVWVDPPEGWKYGFPAIYDPVNDGKMRDWIVRKGYPKQIIQEYGDQWMVRSWPAEEPKSFDE